MQLPAWLHDCEEAWNGWVEMRRKIKKPLTERAQRMAIRKLEELKQEGHDPRSVLEQSEFRCWAGLFPAYGEKASSRPEFTDQHGMRYTVTVEGTRRYV